MVMATFGFRLIVAGPLASCWAMSALSAVESGREDAKREDGITLVREYAW
jgi:hypothetical protein